MSPALIALFAFSLLATYAAGRSAMDAVRWPAGRAVAAAVPIIFIAIACTLAGQAALAVATLAAAAVMSMTLAAGVATISAPLEPGLSSGSLILLPASIAITLVASTTMLSPIGAAMLLLIGIAALMVSPASLEGMPAVARHVPKKMILVLAIILAALASAMGAIAASQLLMISRVVSPGALASIIVAPVAVLPMLGSITDMTHRQRSSAEALSIAIRVALIALTFGIPAVAAMHAVRQHWIEHVALAPAPIPYGVWRIDGTVLILVSLLLLPIFLKRWQPARFEAVLLLFAYLAYIYAAMPELPSIGK